MITQQNSQSNRKKPWQAMSLMIAGALLNLAALFLHDSGALVAVGCSLIAVGAAYSVRTSKRKDDR